MKSAHAGGEPRRSSSARPPTYLGSCVWTLEDEVADHRRGGETVGNVAHRTRLSYRPVDGDAAGRRRHAYDVQTGGALIADENFSGGLSDVSRDDTAYYAPATRRRGRKTTGRTTGIEREGEALRARAYSRGRATPPARRSRPRRAIASAKTLEPAWRGPTCSASGSRETGRLTSGWDVEGRGGADTGRRRTWSTSASPRWQVFDVRLCRRCPTVPVPKLLGAAGRLAPG